MATRKINRKKNITQRNKNKKRGNRLLNKQKKIIKQSKNKKPVKKKETFKIIKCSKCKGEKQIKISKKKIDKLRNAGLRTDDIYKALTVAFCCGNVFGSTSSVEYNSNDLHRGRQERIQKNTNLRNMRLSNSSVLSNNNSSSNRRENEGSSPKSPSPLFVKKESYEIPQKSSSELKEELEKESEYEREYNKKLLAVTGEGSLEL
jgi:hypothetical protein